MINYYNLNSTVPMVILNKIHTLPMQIRCVKLLNTLIIIHIRLFNNKIIDLNR